MEFNNEGDEVDDPNVRLPNHLDSKDKSTISKGKPALNHFANFV